MAGAVGFGRADNDDLANMAGHLADSTAGALASRREISARKRIAERELQAAEQRLADAERRAGPVAFIEVSATLEATSQGTAGEELSYHVSGTSWRPLYDLGLTGDRLTVSYLPEVTQRTEEDSPVVELAPSTIPPADHQSLPELEPWYL